MKVQFCIGGGTIQQGYDPEDFEREMKTDGFYAVEMFSSADTESDFLVIDMNAMWSNSGEALHSGREVKISILGTE